MKATDELSAIVGISTFPIPYSRLPEKWFTDVLTTSNYTLDLTNEVNVMDYSCLKFIWADHAISQY